MGEARERLRNMMGHRGMVKMGMEEGQHREVCPFI